MKLLVVEDHPVTRLGVRQLVQMRWPDARIVEVQLAADAVSQLAAEPFDAVILDLNLSDVRGLEGLICLRRASPATPILVLSAHAERAYATRSLQEGALGYLNKERAPDELVAAIECVIGGGRYITATLAGELADQLVSGSTTPRREGLRHEDLSKQEYRVMLQLVDGLSVSDIAQGMHLSPKTVSTYRTRILEKLDLPGTVELVKYCIAYGLTANR